MDEEERGYGRPSGSQDVSAVLRAGPEAAQGSLARILAQTDQPSKSAATETSPLLPRAPSAQRSRMRRRRGTVSHGDATVGQAVLMVSSQFRGFVRLSRWGDAFMIPFVALEVVRRDWCLVLGESVSLICSPRRLYV